VRLASVEISGFRAIGRLRLTLPDVTVLLGEHNSGKSTVLDALDACLALTAQDPIIDIDGDDFCHGTPGAAGPADQHRVEIRLEVEESTRDEWRKSPLDAAAGRPDNAGLRAARFLVEATRDTAGTITRTVRVDDHPRITADAALAAWTELRARMPVLHLRADRFFFPRESPPNGRAAPHAPDQPILATFRDICATGGRLSPRTLREALREAEDVLESLPEAMLREPSSGRLSLDAIDRPRSALSRLAGGISGYRPGTGAQAAGVFLLMAMFLDARGPKALPEGASPILLIEEPEAHLHPIVASMSWGLLEGLRAQIIATTYGSEIVASTPLRSLRRMINRKNGIEVREIGPDTLEPEELRRVSYHVRVKRGGSLFARAWILIEGETEGWLLPELANLCGYSLPAEGVECIEFAQCGIEPLVKTADALGIAWHLLADGDTSGHGYARTVRDMLRGRDDRAHLTSLRVRDIEQYLFTNGYAHIYRGAAGLTGHAPERPERARSTIARAIKNTSKPQMALRVVEAMAKAGPDGVPPVLRSLIERIVAEARRSVTEG
jgi:putative ATP-dependent endonuclease of OLD family